MIVSILMTGVLLILQQFNLYIFLVLLISSISYFLFVASLGIYTVYTSNEEWAKLLLKRK